MKQLVSVFVLGAVSEAQFPKLRLPEVAFVGRSNVGKSTLLNSIVLSKSLAKTSSTPGKTREINFFIIDNRWVFADLPGFGYASVGKKQRELFTKLNLTYLNKREELKFVFALIDSRHEPTDTDLGLIELYENNNKDFAVILTKCDKISSKLIDERTEQIRYITGECNHFIDVIPHSSKTGVGRNEILGMIKRVVKPI